MPGEPDHRVLVDDELVHFEDCVVDPVIGGSPDLFDVGSRISRRRADAIENRVDRQNKSIGRLAWASIPARKALA